MFENALQMTLSFTGLPKHEAAVLSQILIKGPSSTSELLEALDYSQPQLNRACNSLIERGWIHYRRECKTTKGRPSHTYHLVPQNKDLFREIKTMEEDRIEEIRANYQIPGNILIPELNKEGCTA